MLFLSLLRLARLHLCFNFLLWLCLFSRGIILLFVIILDKSALRPVSIIYRTNKTFGRVSDKVLAPELFECFLNKLAVFRVAVLQSRPLHQLFLIIARNINLLFGERIISRVKHRRRSRRGCRIKILYLLGMKPLFFEV